MSYPTTKMLLTINKFAQYFIELQSFDADLLSFQKKKI
jgi:hypothetical protein